MRIPLILLFGAVLLMATFPACSSNTVMEGMSGVAHRSTSVRGMATYWQANQPEQESVRGSWLVANDNTAAELLLTDTHSQRDTVYLRVRGDGWVLGPQDKRYGHNTTVDLRETSDSVIVILDRVMSRTDFNLAKD